MGGFLKKKLGPAPVWVWLAAAAVVLLYFWWRNRHLSSQTSSADDGTGDDPASPNFDGSPSYMNTGGGGGTGGGGRRTHHRGHHHGGHKGGGGHKKHKHAPASYLPIEENTSPAPGAIGVGRVARQGPDAGGLRIPLAPVLAVELDEARVLTPADSAPFIHPSRLTPAIAATGERPSGRGKARRRRHASVIGEHVA